MKSEIMRVSKEIKEEVKRLQQQVYRDTRIWLSESEALNRLMKRK